MFIYLNLDPFIDYNIVGLGIREIILGVGSVAISD